MNQILSVEMPKNKARNKSNKTNIKTIIIFFCVILIIFAIAIGVIVIFTMIDKKNNENEGTPSVITGTQPQVDVEIENEQKLNIIVTHDKQISSIVYSWNNEEPIEIKDIGQTNYELEVEIPVGENTLNISVTDINGVTKQEEPRQITGTQQSEGLKLTLEPDGNNIKIIVESNSTISYISYNWDGEEEKQIQINDVKTEQIIEIPEGEHTLNVMAVDLSGAEASDSQKIIGDNKPTLTVKTDKINFFIEASDDQGLDKITINLNGQDLDEIVINGEKQYQGTIPLQDGDNRMIITVYNKNGIKNEQRVRMTK